MPARIATRNWESDRRNSRSQIFRKAKGSRKIRKIATFKQQDRVNKLLFGHHIKLLVHKLREFAHVCKVRADSNSRGRLHLWLKQQRRPPRPQRPPKGANPPPRRLRRRPCAKQQRRRQRKEGLPKSFCRSEVPDWAFELQTQYDQRRFGAYRAYRFQMAGDSDTRHRPYFI